MKKLTALLLILALALSVTACTGTETPVGTPSQTTGVAADTTGAAADTTGAAEALTSFTFTVVDLEGKETTFEISTDKTIVGEALMEQELIAGEQGEYGLYVKTVNGVTLDYEKDGKYWAFYINGEYAMTGVEKTDITAGATYTFKAE